MVQFDFSSARLYAILDTSYVPPERWVSTYQALVQGGADVIQLRAKTESRTSRMVLLDAVLPDYATSGIPLIVNDDLELAMRYPGMGIGLHLGQDDMDVTTARERLGPDAPIGLSTHSVAQAKRAIALEDQLNYFAVGPLYRNQTKPDYEPVGLGLIEKVKALNPPLPFFCIGGVNRRRIGDVLAAGAPRVVVVSDILKAEDPVAVIRELKSAWQQPSLA